MPLLCKGGPPPQGFKTNKAVEQTLARLYFNMKTGPVWQQGAIGYVRDCDNRFSMMPFFEEDVAFANLSVLPVPEESHPLEGPEYKKMCGLMESKLAPVVQRTQKTRAEWSHWEITGNKLSLFSQHGQVTHHKVEPLATFSLSQKLWRWQVKEPLFSEEVFRWEKMVVSFGVLWSLEWSQQLVSEHSGCLWPL